MLLLLLLLLFYYYYVITMVSNDLFDINNAFTGIARVTPTRSPVALHLRPSSPNATQSPLKQSVTAAFLSALDPLGQLEKYVVICSCCVRDG